MALTLETVAQPMLIAGADGQIIAANGAAETFFGGSVRGLTCCEVFGCGSTCASWDGCLTEVALAAATTIVRATTVVQASVRPIWLSASREPGGRDEVVFRLAPNSFLSNPALSLPDAEPDGQLRIFALGKTCVEGPRGWTDDDWLYQRPGQLLKFLVVNRGSLVAVDAIAEALWPHLGRRGPLTVRHAVHLLRGHIDVAHGGEVTNSFVVTERSAYGLDRDSVAIDADTFETAVRLGVEEYMTGERASAERRLLKALALYRGDFLSEEPYAEWAIEERERLRSLLEVPLRVMAELRLRDGDLAGASRFVEELAHQLPLDSDVQCLQIAIWLRRGQHTRALRHYDLISARFARALGASPGFDIPTLMSRREDALHAL